jgi:isocitrate dehydrogenase
MKTNTNAKNDKYTSIRVKKNTKVDVNKFLDQANKAEDCGKITFDALIGYFLENVSNEDIEKLQLKSITWAHEDKRLRRLWEKKKGKVSENKWKELLYIGQLSEFIAENSRLQAASST